MGVEVLPNVPNLARHCARTGRWRLLDMPVLFSPMTAAIGVKRRGDRVTHPRTAEMGKSNREPPAHNHSILGVQTSLVPSSRFALAERKFWPRTKVFPLPQPDQPYPS